MKKRTAIIGALVALLPIGQPLMIGTGAALTSAALMVSIPEKANAESAQFYLGRGFNKGESGDWYGAISDFTKALEMNPSREMRALIIFGRGAAKEQIGNIKSACSDWRKASSLGADYAGKYLKKVC